MTLSKFDKFSGPFYTTIKCLEKLRSVHVLALDALDRAGYTAHMYDAP